MSVVTVQQPFIEAQPQPNCYLCETPGQLLYACLVDRLYSAPGEWNLRRCPRHECGLVWLDPMPARSAIGKAYESYFTHSTDDPQAGNRTYQRWLQLSRVYKLWLRVVGIAEMRRRAELNYLHEVRPGRLLDVGCGDGHWLARMRSLGWSVEGQELDSEAALVARNHYGLTVHTCELERLELPAESFDAIVLSHVLEHVHDPVGLLREARRILRRDGTLVVLTPNVNGLGHRRFRQNWVALDPPRHLMLFSPPTLRQVAERAGFTQVGLRTTPVRAQFIGMASRDIARTGRHDLEGQSRLDQLIAATLYEWAAWVAWRRRGDDGDECVMQLSP